MGQQTVHTNTKSIICTVNYHRYNTILLSAIFWNMLRRSTIKVAILPFTAAFVFLSWHPELDISLIYTSVSSDGYHSSRRAEHHYCPLTWQILIGNKGTRVWTSRPQLLWSYVLTRFWAILRLDNNARIFKGGLPEQPDNDNNTCLVALCLGLPRWARTRKV